MPTRTFSLRMPFNIQSSSSSSHSSNNSHHRISVVSDASAGSSANGSSNTRFNPGSNRSSAYNLQRASMAELSSAASSIRGGGGYSPDDERSPSTPTASGSYPNSISAPIVDSSTISAPIISPNSADSMMSTPRQRDTYHPFRSSIAGFGTPKPEALPYGSPLTPNAAMFAINDGDETGNSNDRNTANGKRESTASKDHRFSNASSLYYDNYDSTSLYTVDSKIDDDALRTLAPRPGIHQSESGRTSRRTSNDDRDDDDDDWESNSGREERLSLSDVGEAYQNQIWLGGASPQASPAFDRGSADKDRDRDKDKVKLENGETGGELAETNGRASTPTPGSEGYGVNESEASPPDEQRHSKRQSIGLWQREDNVEVLREEVWRLMGVVEDEVAKRQKVEAALKRAKEVIHYNTKALIKNSLVDLNKPWMHIRPLLNDDGRMPDTSIFPYTVGTLMKLNDATLTSLIVFYGLQQTDMQYYTKFSALRDHLGIDP